VGGFSKERFLALDSHVYWTNAPSRLSPNIGDLKPTPQPSWKRWM
jgi:hypothetical protein